MKRLYYFCASIFRITYLLSPHPYLIYCMKYYFLLALLALGVSFASVSPATAMPAFVAPTANAVVAPVNPATQTATAKPAKAVKAKAKWLQNLERTAAFKIAKPLAPDNYVLAIVLALLIGGLGIHRFIMGAGGIIILWYVLLSFLFGLGMLLGFIDFIVLLIDGNTARFEGNNNVFACFGGGGGGGKKK